MAKQELLELLKKARKQLKKYHVPDDEQTITLSIDTLEKALSEQPAIVHCKDCKYIWWFSEKNGDAVCGNGRHKPDWFCGDGERRTD